MLNNKSQTFLSDLTMRNPLDDNSELLWHMGFAKQLKAKNEKALVLKTGGNYRLKKGANTFEV